MEKNLTTGSVLGNVIRFSLPYFLSYFLQTLYGMADLFIIGQFCGVSSITAVSIGSQVMHMVTVMIVGLAMGATVMIARAIGGGRKEEAALAIGNTASLFMALSVLLTVGLLLAIKPIVAVMATPAEALVGAERYLTICFIGIPFITAYNIISSIFRGMGDSKSPMIFIAIACAANIALDYLLIGGLKLDAAGAALGTTLSQTISVLISLSVILRRKSGISLTSKDLHPRKNIVQSLLKIGLPVALQDGFIQVAFIVITVIANRRGLNDAAAVGIVEKVIAILFLVPSSMLSTISALCAQNIGAGKHDRAQLTLRYAIILSVSWSALAAVGMQFAAEPVVALFTENNVVITLGGQYMRGYVWDCILAGVHFCFSGYFCAYGMSGISFLHNLLSIVCVRVPLAYYASIAFADTLFPMGLASPGGSALSVAICVGIYLRLRRKHKNYTKSSN